MARKSTARTGPTARRSRRNDHGTPKGRDTVDGILVAAEEVLISAGYAGFTARKVAARADIALGNLTYHFPTLADLHRALVEFVLRRYLPRWEAFRESEGAPGGNATSVGGVLDWLITDAVQPRTTRLFRELWAMASHSESAAAAMDDFYSQGVRAAAQVLRVMFRGLSADAALDLAYLMAVVSEGAIVLFGTLPGSARRVRALRVLATRAVEQLAAAAKPPARARTRRSAALRRGRATRGRPAPV
jgi:AcrR family transcriptional regulator